MISADHRPAWLVLAVGENRAFGSNDGYRDEPESHYRWDSTVPNHARLEAGQHIVLWDKKSSLGMSVIASIDRETAVKTIYSCPSCGKAHIKARKNKEPRYKCFACQTNFETPAAKTIEVTEYTSHHSEAYVDLGGLIPGDILRSVCKSPKSQLSLRPLVWEAFKAAATAAGGPELLTVVEAASNMAAGGHRTAHVRVRLGQSGFRKSLLDANGPVCIFTGQCPPAALEAAHLYSFAELGVHHEHGGFLMRRDLHRLFDLGLLAVHPKALTVDVSPTLANYPTYSVLAGLSLRGKVRDVQVDWIREHWREHRESMAAIA
ncbi:MULTISPECIES: HNH endonuclease [unclassified Arthrobacter]|uniref:HNH endonuclease n=1 Tax=unclassified Arthrobacter TaxID=235627 RepID=UPI002E0CD747|nr:MULTISPECIES: HNH endonuclease [unclassified Arthrobacter]MEC5191731.1 putative RNA-binding Zn-ribbon protein involved in translation (DUF1610 family) [Arthrobacter sp. MP_M4]MEC5203421.1 putative RNA-binding Zn-ribbon protein involved in translation (DUF1610 family) [Arthrobacter sp. MP_M7]